MSTGDLSSGMNPTAESAQHFCAFAAYVLDRVLFFCAREFRHVLATFRFHG